MYIEMIVRMAMRRTELTLNVGAVIACLLMNIPVFSCNALWIMTGSNSSVETVP